MGGGGQFLLQVVGITKGRVLCRPSVKLRKENIADVLIMKDSTYILTHTPSYECTGLANTGCDVYVAHCPPEEEAEYELVTEFGERFTHTMFLAEFRENPENEQIICINPKVAIELMESVLEKNLISCLLNIRDMKRNVPMFLEGKVNSTFNLVGFCEDNVPFIMEVANVPFAEYRPEEQAIDKANYEKAKAEKEAAQAARAAAGIVEEEKKKKEGEEEEDDEYVYYPYLKASYFPEANSKAVNAATIKRINDLAMIAKESVVRCVLGYIIERTDINKFEISNHNPEYRQAVINAVSCGVHILPVVVSWTPEGVCFFVTEQIQIQVDK